MFHFAFYTSPLHWSLHTVTHFNTDSQFLQQISMAPSFAINGGFPGTRITPPSDTGRFAAVYSEVQNSRIDHALPLPSVLKNPFVIVDGPQSTAAGNPGLSFPPFATSIFRQHFHFHVI